MTAAIYQFQKQEEAKFVCSACGADRSCDCNAPALEKLAEIREQQRQRVRAHRERKSQENQSSRNVTTGADEDADIEADVEPANYRGAFLIRADQAKQFAVYSGPITPEIIAMARQVAMVWKQLADTLEEEL